VARCSRRVSGARRRSGCRARAAFGKSALGVEFAADARAAGWTVVAVTGALAGRPYGALAAVVEQLCLAEPALLDAVGPAARAVLAMLTPLAAPAPALPGPLGRHQVIGAFRRLLLAASRGGDVLLQIDDAHVLDDAEVDVVLHLATAGPPVFVWLGARPPRRRPRWPAAWPGWPARSICSRSISSRSPEPTCAR
jgi:hypothetical protein